MRWKDASELVWLHIGIWGGGQAKDEDGNG